MTRGSLLAIVVLGVVAAAACLAARPAAAATGEPACQLPGYVAAVGDRPCPSSSPSGDAVDPLGGVVGYLASGTAAALVKVIIRIAVTGAAGALRLTGSLLASTTRPQLLGSWFSAAYWRVASISVLLTLPFLFAAAVHALLRSELALVGRAAFGYLPLAFLGVAIAAPVTTLLLGATDEMSAIVAGAAGRGDGSFLARAASSLSTPSLIHGDLFVAFIVAMLTIVAAIALWIELLVRGAAVDVIVLMLPLFFAAMVWPARRVWAIRAIETLVALILSKFAIVAVLTLGAAALSHLDNGPGAVLTGLTLIVLATASPWALLRILPLHEIAAAGANGLSAGPRSVMREAARQLSPRLPAEPSPRDGDLVDVPSSEPSGGDAVLARLAALGDGRGATRGRDGVEAMPPSMQAGIDAVEDTDASGRRARSRVATLATFADDLADARPPVEPPFGHTGWKGFVIGEGMRPPVIDDASDAPRDGDAGTPPEPAEPPSAPEPPDDRDPLAPPEDPA